MKRKWFATMAAAFLCVAMTTAVFASTGPKESVWGGFPSQKRSSYSYGYTCCVQRILLNTSGTHSMIANSGGIDGSFGSNTEKAVKAFQELKGLGVDGSWGPATWRAAYRSLDYLNPASGFYWYNKYYSESEPSVIVRQGTSTLNWGARPEGVSLTDSWIVFRQGD